jgi:integrase
MGKIKVRKFLRDSLREKYSKGHGHAKCKGIHNETNYIHSHKTYITYLAQCNHFADWLSEKGIKDSTEAFKLIPEYGEYLENQGKSAWTIYTAMSGIAKAYGLSTKSLGYQPPKRERVAIKRSRYSAIRDNHFSIKNNEILIDFASCTGLRRHELAALKGTQLACKSDGTFCIRKVKGKGGKIRDVDIIGSPKEIENIVKIMTSVKDGKVFSHIHSGFDQHYYRSIFAARAYKKNARDLSQLPDEAKYYCRKDRVGNVYDREAMKYASMQLGHNRIDVIANNYLHNM